MARPRRRRPTLPDHHPRAIRAALRREVYAIGDARRQLDEIEFRVGTSPAIGDAYPTGLGIEVIVNGVSTVAHMGSRHVPATLQWIPTQTLRERDGKRTAYFANCTCGQLECGRMRAEIAVAGRYVVWNTADRHFGGPLVFDRASYRESLDAALSAIRADETREEWALREFLDRASWEATAAAGLVLHDAVVAADPVLDLVFEDPMWHTLVIVAIPWDPSNLARAVERALVQLAQGDLDNWDVVWRPPFRGEHVIPPYPPTWRRRGWDDLLAPR